MKPHASTPPTLPKRLSLVTQTVNSLCEGIQSGHWHEVLPGERELCESLQVSRRTIRAALEELQRNGWLEVAGRQKRRIRRQRARVVADPQKKIIGILTPGSFLSLSPQISFVVDTLRSRLTAAGYLVQFHIHPACFVASPDRALSQFVSEHPATVWLILSAQEPMQRWFNRQKLSCLILGSCAPGINLPSVDVDFHAVCRHAGGLLWRKGHRRIALILSRSVYGGDIASEEGLRSSLKDRPGAQFQVLRHDNTAASLCAILDGVMNTPKPPTAYVIGGPAHALTVTMHLLRRGRRIPEDVTIIARDNDPILDAASPTIACYAVQPAQFAARVALVIRQLAETRTPPAHAIRLIPTFIPGESA